MTPPALDPNEVALAATVAACAAAVGYVARRRLALPVWASVLLALALRAFVAAIASRYTPPDVTHHFRLTGEYVRAGRDPMAGATPLPLHQWNFLPLMPYVHALELRLGLPWEYAVKTVPILADCVTVWLVTKVADTDGATRALQYAVNPVSLLVVSVHGQVEPVALCLAMAGVALYLRQRWTWAGVAVGAAVAAKTWPVLVLLALLRPRERWTWRFLAGAAVVPLATFASGLLFLDTRVGATVRGLTGYTSYVGGWGWTGTAVAHGVRGIVGYESPLGRPGSALTLLAVAAALWTFRRAEPAVRVAAAVAAPLLVTAGFGVQYLMWPVPFLFAAGFARRASYTAAAGAWLLLFYAPHAFPSHAVRDTYLVGASWLVVAVLAGALWSRGRKGA